MSGSREQATILDPTGPGSAAPSPSPKRRFGSRWRLAPGFWLEAAIAAGLFVSAVIVRLPNFMTIPALTDEFKEVGWAISMIVKNRWPLVAFDAYDGPLFAYLVSFAFRLLGFNLYLPRLLVLLVGALTVVAAYAAARQFARGDRRVGLLAAVLLAANAHHILFNSHVAWSNSTTPLFSTLALLAYFAGTRQKRPGPLVLSGALFGVALQTHPSVLLLAPGLAIDFLVNAGTRAWLRRPAPYLSLLAAGLAYAPVLYYNFVSQFGSIQTATTSATYAYETEPSLYKAWLNIQPLLTAVAQVALGIFPPFGPRLLGMDLAVIFFWIVTAIIFLAWARRGEPFALILVTGALVFLATFNRFFAIPDSGRYYQPLMPVIFAAWAYVAVHAGDRLRLTRSPVGRWGARALAPLVVAGLAALSLLSLSGYYEASYVSGRNNASMLAMVEAIHREPGVPVLIDYELAKLRTGRGGNVGEDLIYWLGLEGRPVQLVTALDKGAGLFLRNRLRSLPRAFLISFTNASETLGPEVEIEPLISTRFPCPACPVPQDFVLYLWEE